MVLSKECAAKSVKKPHPALPWVVAIIKHVKGVVNIQHSQRGMQNILIGFILVTC